MGDLRDKAKNESLAKGASDQFLNDYATQTGRDPYNRIGLRDIPSAEFSEEWMRRICNPVKGNARFLTPTEKQELNDPHNEWGTWK